MAGPASRRRPRQHLLRDAGHRAARRDRCRRVSHRVLRRGGDCTRGGRRCSVWGRYRSGGRGRRLAERRHARVGGQGQCCQRCQRCPGDRLVRRAVAPVPGAGRGRDAVGPGRCGARTAVARSGPAGRRGRYEHLAIPLSRHHESCGRCPAGADRPGVGAPRRPRTLDRGGFPRPRPGRFRRGDSRGRRRRGPQPGPAPRHGGGLLGPGRGRPPGHPRTPRRRESSAGPGPGGRRALLTGGSGAGWALAGAATGLHDRGVAAVPSGRGLDRRRCRRRCHRRRHRRLHARARTRGGDGRPGVPCRRRLGGRWCGPGRGAPSAPALGRGGLVRDAHRPGRGRCQPGAGLGRGALAPAGAAGGLSAFRRVGGHRAAARRRGDGRCLPAPRAQRPGGSPRKRAG